MAVHGHDGARTLPVELEVEGDAQGNRPFALENVAVEVDTQDVVGVQLFPQQVPRVAQEGPVGLAVGDVTGQMVVVTLPPQGAGQENEFLAGREVGEKSVRSGTERESHGST